MKLHLTLLLTLFCAFHLIAQNKQLGISFSPDFNYRFTKYEDLTLHIHENEMGKIGFKAGIHFNLPFKSEKWVATVGLGYANRGFQSKEQNIQNTLNEPKIANSQRYRYHFHYADIPLQLKYYPTRKGNAHFFVALSSIPAFMFRETMVHIYYFDNQTQKVNNGSFPNRFMNFFTELSLGSNFLLNSQYFLTLEPHFQYGWISLQNESFTTRLWSFGLRTCIYTNF